MNKAEFVTGSNGGAAFQVKITEKHNSHHDTQTEKIVSIFKQSDNLKQFIPPFFIEFEKNPMVMFQTNEIFIGKSAKNKVTEFECSFGRKFDGRSLLCNFGSEKNYILIERNITIFSAKTKITSFFSPVGHSGVLYPWAVDEEKNIYLLPYGPYIVGDSIPENIVIDANLDPFEMVDNNSSEESKIKTKKINIIAEIASRNEIIYAFR
jgi:hypothetical protein